MAAAITQGTGIECKPYVMDQVNPPMAMIGRRAMDPRMVLSAAKNVYGFRVSLFMARQSTVDTQRAMDNACATSGSTSMKQAIEDGTLWSAAVDYATVTLIGDTHEREVLSAVYLVTDFDVEVCW